jgi:hypothetical protein
MVTDVPVTEKVADVAPLAMVTVDGKVTGDPDAALRAMVTPPLGAGPLILTVAILVAPMLIEVGEKTRLLNTGVITETEADLLTPPRDAAIVVETGEETVRVVIENVTLVLPAGTVTLSGTVATPPLADRSTS